MSAQVILTIVGIVFGSTGLFAFIQFLITRGDKKDEKEETFQTDMNAKLDDLKNDISDIKKDIISMQDQFRSDIELLDDKIEKDIAIQARIRILSASDEMRHDVHHSYEYFRQLNRDITVYTNYCTEHPEFKNNEAINSIEYINRVFQDCLEKNSFLS